MQPTQLANEICIRHLNFNLCSPEKIEVEWKIYDVQQAAHFWRKRRLGIWVSTGRLSFFIGLLSTFLNCLLKCLVAFAYHWNVSSVSLFWLIVTLHLLSCCIKVSHWSFSFAKVESFSDYTTPKSQFCLISTSLKIN